MTRWYRAYEGTISDPKLAEAAAEANVKRCMAVAVWHAILESAAATQKRGEFDTTPRRIAAVLGEQTVDIEALFKAFREIGMLEGNVITAWSKRQYESDSSTARVQKHREAKRGNGDETFLKRDVTAPDTDTDTDTDIIHFPAERVAPRATHKSNKPIRGCRFPATGSIAYVQPFSGLAKKHCSGVDPDRLAGLFRAWCQQKQMSLDQDGIAGIWTSFCITHRDNARTG